MLFFVGLARACISFAFELSKYIERIEKGWHLAFVAAGKSLSTFLDAFMRAFCGIGAGVNWLTDVAPFAKRNCHRCFGRGTVMFNRRLSPCDCAGRRFMAANREHVDVLANGDVVWKLSPQKITL